MNRRHFLGSLAALSAGMALDPERLLWVPGRKTYFDIVKPAPVVPEWFDIVYPFKGQWRPARLSNLSHTFRVPVMESINLRWRPDDPPQAPTFGSMDFRYSGRSDDSGRPIFLPT